MQAALNLLFPHQCVSCNAEVDRPGLCPSCWAGVTFLDDKICRGCGVPLLGDDVRPEDRCDACLKRPRPWAEARSAFLYAEDGRALVMKFKHGDRTDLAVPLSGWLADAARPMVTPQMRVVPIPLHWRRMMKRGYNQAALLARPMARALSLPYLPDALVRPKSTAPLQGVSRDDRFGRLDGAILVRESRRAFLADADVLLVDDVMTSGATLESATSACYGAGARRVCVVTLARASLDD